MVKDTALVNVMSALAVNKSGHKYVNKDMVKDTSLVMWALTVYKSGHEWSIMV